MSGPNVLLIVVDQMAYDVMSGLGHPTVRTPNIDALLARGVAFTDAYCSSPICLPSRASLMTGRLARRDGVYDNGSELPAAAPTVAHVLNRAGYTTVLSGKMHFVGPDQHHGFRERLTRDAAPVSFMLTPDWTRGPVPNPGTSVRRLRLSPTAPWTWQLSYDEEVLHRSLERLRVLSYERSPFLLCVSFVHPHDPFVLPEAYWSRYADADVELPRAPAVPLEEMHPFNRWIQIHHELDRQPLTTDETVAARRAYYAAIGYVDDLVGRLLAEVDRLGLGQDTVVVLTSDHGEMLGEHGMWFKRTFFDGAARVPLVVAVPGVTPGVRRAPVSLMDLAPTLADIADAPDSRAWAATLDGVSLLPDLRDDDPARGANRAVPAEYLAEGTVEPLLMLRQGRYKLVHVRGCRPLLFDLQEDPAELRDLADEPSTAEVRARMERELLRDVDPDVLREQVLTSQRERLLVHAGSTGTVSWEPELVPAGRVMYPAPTAEPGPPRG